MKLHPGDRLTNPRNGHIVRVLNVGAQAVATVCEKPIKGPTHVISRDELDLGKWKKI